MIKPTIGRVVLYHSGVATGHPAQQPNAALVAFVHSDSLINLGVFDMNGNSFGATDVPLIQDGESPPPAGHYAEWMPYQKGQAAKTEALEAKIAESEANTDRLPD